MASHRFRIIDADGHVIEPAGMWERSIAAVYRERAPRVVVAPTGQMAYESGGRLSPRTECVSSSR